MGWLKSLRDPGLFKKREVPNLKRNLQASHRNKLPVNLEAGKGPLRFQEPFKARRSCSYRNTSVTSKALLWMVLILKNKSKADKRIACLGKTLSKQMSRVFQKLMLVIRIWSQLSSRKATCLAIRRLFQLPEWQNSPGQACQKRMRLI